LSKLGLKTRQFKVFLRIILGQNAIIIQSFLGALFSDDVFSRNPLSDGQAKLLKKVKLC